ncbi:hypothetical protein BO71DRAFT_123090 [Aspergillus ellipticus CBS 707.79]|uniref:Uncharacterized protein n=1 Tax=Aspergillus ellipticus CBS 707.79 TaxID=1448320 RepID=A0A319ECZ7_9EURO|nr:hypothetical protein BO71DRAFT_123090 [Aspergillus ellipticus CBS 707.79]
MMSRSSSSTGRSTNIVPFQPTETPVTGQDYLGVVGYPGDKTYLPGRTGRPDVRGVPARQLGPSCGRRATGDESFWGTLEVPSRLKKQRSQTFYDKVVGTVNGKCLRSPVAVCEELNGNQALGSPVSLPSRAFHSVVTERVTHSTRHVEQNQDGLMWT